MFDGFPRLAKYIAFAMPSVAKGNRKVRFQRLTQRNYTASPMPRCKHRKTSGLWIWQVLPVGKEYPAKVAAFRANLARPFAKRGECASCGNAQHLSCQSSHRVIPRKLSARLSPCLFLRAISPAIASQISPLYHHCPQGSAHSTGNLAQCFHYSFGRLYHVIM